jgi:hypothetical protein
VPNVIGSMPKRIPKSWILSARSLDKYADDLVLAGKIDLCLEAACVLVPHGMAFPAVIGVGEPRSRPPGGSTTGIALPALT